MARTGVGGPGAGVGGVGRGSRIRLTCAVSEGLRAASRRYCTVACRTGPRSNTAWACGRFSTSSACAASLSSSRNIVGSFSGSSGIDELRVAPDDPGVADRLHQPPRQPRPGEQVELVVVAVVVLAERDLRPFPDHALGVAVLGERRHRPEAGRLDPGREVHEKLEGLAEVLLLLEVRLRDQVEVALEPALDDDAGGLVRFVLGDGAIEDIRSISALPDWIPMVIDLRPASFSRSRSSFRVVVG